MYGLNRPSGQQVKTCAREGDEGDEWAMMAKEVEGDECAEGTMGTEVAEGTMGAEVAEGAEEAEGEWVGLG